MRSLRKFLRARRKIKFPKIILTATIGGNPQYCIGKTLIAEPYVGATQTFITVGAFNTHEEAEACNKYINTKFCKALLSIKKSTQHNPPDTWENVPLQDFTTNSDIDWSQSLPGIDRQLYRKYKLNQKQIAFIEGNFKYREDLL